MSLVSFSKPTDVDILKNIDKENEVIGFADKGSIYQNAEETLYVRLIKTRVDKNEVLRKITFSKKGISWLFKAIETITFSTNNEKNKSA